MDKSTNYLSDYVSRKGINLKNMSHELNISYDRLYSCLGKKGKKRPLRGDELLAICNFIGLNPKEIISKINEG